jgi:tetratricopeptide (TPR) repeat protein
MRRLLEILFLLGFGCFVYWSPQFDHSFVTYDDFDYVVANDHVRNGLSWENIIWAFTSLNGDTSYWHPLTWISHQLDCEVFGLEAGWHKTVNIIFHCYNSLLLYGLLRRFPLSAQNCLVIAALFASHPLHVESVVWVSERKDVLSTFFGLMTLHLYFDYAADRSPKRYLGVIAAYACALMSKPMVVTLPLLMLLLDHWPLEQGLRKPNRLPGKGFLLLEKFPLFAMSLGLAALTVIAQQDLGIVPTLTELPAPYRFANALNSYCWYVLKMLIPIDLAVRYPYPDSFSIWTVISGLIFFVLTTSFALKHWRSNPYFAFGWIWYIVVLLPVIGIVQTSTQARADRYTYLSSVGIFIIVVCGLDKLVSRYRRRIFIVLGTIAFTAYLSLTWRQIGYWKNSEALYRRAVSVTTGNAAMHLALAKTLHEESDRTESLFHYHRALESSPESAKIYESLATFHRQTGELNLELIHLRKSLFWAPNQGPLLDRLAYILATHPDREIRKADEAITLAKRAYQLQTKGASSYLHTWAAAEAAKGNYQTAVRLSEQALLGKNAPNASRFRDRRNLYRQERPFRDLDLPRIWDEH